ncbi:type IV pilus modification protein PilV [Psychrobacter ciconiae]|uniref:type IV pilus modification protein PilV n=1 Tax=Psychrobacter ciconiae TaxID=1553449 RepID=UPI0019195C21|nr:type IV pilus modification protein PilV [Psychrobacter ciconiae]
MQNIKNERGVGLVEVLVAVLLLAVAVLGFSALQMRAVSATDESLVRTKALTLTRNLSEIMRTYPEAYVTGSGASFTKAAASDTGAKPTIQAVIQGTGVSSATVDGALIQVNSASDICLSNEIKTVGGKKVVKQSCTLNQLAARDALIVKSAASAEDININVVLCPGTDQQNIRKQMCVITAWNDTKALLSDDDNDTNACASAAGIYKIGNHCLISEAY